MQPLGIDVPDIQVVPKTVAAEVLVVGGDDWAISDASRQLQAQGRKVHRCWDSADTPFPCNAMTPGRGCPLDLHPVDAVLVVSVRPRSSVSLSEMGAVCGVRDGLPLVIAGISERSTFSKWATRVPPSGDLVTTCDSAVADASALGSNPCGGL